MANNIDQQKTAEVGSAFDLLPKSWEIVKRNWQAFAVVNVLSLLSALAAFSPDYDKDDYGNKFMAGPVSGLSGWELGSILGLGAVVAVALTAASIILYAMSVVLQVRSSAGKTPAIGELFEAAKKNWLWLKLVGLIIVSGLIVVVGLILLIVPGIIAIGRIIMAPYLMADKNLGIMDSLKASNKLSRNNTEKVWAAIGVAFLIAIAGGILNSFPLIGPLLGTLLSIAFSLVLVLRYQQIENSKIISTKK